MTTLLFVMLAFLDWRISYLLVCEGGMNHFLRRFREALKVDKTLDNPADQPNWLAGAFSCMYCMTFWVGVLIAFVYPDLDLQTRLVLPFALSGAALAVHKTWH